uniref:Uncharacterized protein n=1 Tax=Romanomermis culicivorax TaxID=13658 RepID=A0A915JRG5_ROMCU
MHIRDNEPPQVFGKKSHKLSTFENRALHFLLFDTKKEAICRAVNLDVGGKRLSSGSLRASEKYNGFSECLNLRLFILTTLVDFGSFLYFLRAIFTISDCPVEKRRKAGLV